MNDVTNNTNLSKLLRVIPDTLITGVFRSLGCLFLMKGKIRLTSVVVNLLFSKSFDD